MTAFANNLNGIASGTTVTTTNSGGVSGTAFNFVSAPAGGSITAQAAAAYEGATGLQFVYPTGTTAGYAYWTTTAAVGVRVAASTWFKLAALPANPDRLLGIGQGTVNLTAAGQITIVAANSTSSPLAVAEISADAWMFVQLAATSNASTTAGRIEARVYTATGQQVISYDSGASVNAGVAANPSVIFGRGVSGAAGAATHSFDLLAADNALPVGSFPGTAPVNPYATGQFLPFF